MGIVSNQVNPVIDEGAKKVEEIGTKAVADLQTLEESSAAKVAQIMADGEARLQALLDAAKSDLQQLVKSTVEEVLGEVGKYKITASISLDLKQGEAK
jgi:DNA-binding ferritin-like protein